MKYFLRLIVVCFSLAILAGCATKKNMELSDNFWKDKNQKIAVARTVTPKPQVYHVGNQGLLALAIHTSMAKSIDHRLEQEDVDWYPALQQAFVKRLQSHNMNTKAASYPINVEQLRSLNKDINQYSDLNYSSVIVPLNIKTLLIVKLNALGAIRTYSGLIPMGPPKAYCSLTGELIDAQDQHLLWRYEANVSMPVKGEWDQPPAYSNLTNALKLATITAQQEVIDNFFSGH